jgi:hypothetical protein
MRIGGISRFRHRDFLYWLWTTCDIPPRVRYRIRGKGKISCWIFLTFIIWIFLHRLLPFFLMIFSVLQNLKTIVQICIYWWI